MTPSTFAHRLRGLRVEDVLAALVAVLLFSYIGLARAAGALPRAGGDTWTVSLIALPMSIIVFLVSLRYALGSDGTSFSRWFAEVTEIIRDWLPFLLFLLFYATFHSTLWETIQPATADSQLLALDRALMGETPSVAMQLWITTWLTNFLSLCYFLHLVFPPLLAGPWYRRDKRMFRELLLAILICGALGTTGYLLVPAVGPGIAFPGLYTTSLDGSLYHPINDVMGLMRAPRDAFPSLHAGLSAVVLWYSWKYGKVAFLILLPFVVGNWISTLYLRYHYLTDVLAGFVVAWLSVVLAGAALRLEARLQTR